MLSSPPGGRSRRVGSREVVVEEIPSLLPAAVGVMRGAAAARRSRLRRVLQGAAPRGAALRPRAATHEAAEPWGAARVLFVA
ncbi:hypothetical protein BRADI_1g16204v3 [Brachypodium distachyon]|uniref:Uncharacterized protein n=1 Tax=Brachypodium distachyon TaxID=15368 RepID=A0A2K2DJR4_BRADI|nr:hypothetical protein BRADI_1g16204v3 [Brachypodium distachyon]